jgi:GNAT superfamily N-acetyltransferase
MASQLSSVQTQARVFVRPMQESDLSAARAICSTAFGTFIGVPEPEKFMADRDYISTRWRADPGAALVAEVDGVLAGSNFAQNWGSFAFFGPLTIRPDLWNRGIAQALLPPTLDLFQSWGVKEAGLFTFAHSAKHVCLYQKFGFWPRFLTAVMSKPIAQPAKIAWYGLSSANEQDRATAIDACRELTGSIFDGLDVTREISSVQNQRLGETVLIWEGDLLDAFAVCHCGEQTEAGAGACYVKFAAVRPGANARRNFERLLSACEALAATHGLQRIEAGVSLARTHAYRSMLERGFRTQVQGVAMHRPDSPAYNRPDVYIIDDWR